MADLIPAMNIVPAQPAIPVAPQEKKDEFYRLPTSTTTNLTMEVFAAGDAIDEIGLRKQLYSKGSNIIVQQDGLARRITLKSKNSEVSIEVNDITDLAGNNKPAKKIFTLALIKINEQALSGDVLTRDFVTFAVSELVENGMYKNTKTASAGLKKAISALTSIKLSGEDRVSSSFEAGAIFPKIKVRNGVCTIKIDSELPWASIARFITILPSYYFQLGNRASDLLWYIFYVARQRTKEIKEHGYFTISFRAIHHRLQLPSEEGNSFPGRTIKEPIEAAITEIEDAHHKTYGNNDFALEPVYNDAAPIREFLDRGYLRVSLAGEFSEKFIAIADSKQKKIGVASKRKARIEEKAKVAALTEKLKKDDEHLT